MHGVHSTVWIEVDVLLGREEYEALAALEKTVEIVVEVMVLISMSSKQRVTDRAHIPALTTIHLLICRARGWLAAGTGFP